MRVICAFSLLGAVLQGEGVAGLLINLGEAVSNKEYRSK